jgi:glucokinase
VEESVTRRRTTRVVRGAYRLGIDLGGTKMHAVIINARGRVLAMARAATHAEAGYTNVLKRLHDLADAVIARSTVRWRDVSSIGVGMPGPIDQARGVVMVAPNLGWKNKPVVADLRTLMSRRVVLGNDAKCGALAEATYGAAKGAHSAAALFVGTGLGVGLILAGNVIAGEHGFAGEIGHVLAPFAQVRCACGQVGCLETVTSKTGIARMVTEQAKKGVRCKLTYAKSNKVRSSDLLRAWKDGCPATRKAIKQSARGLAWGISALGGTFDPQVFVLGGGVMEALGKIMLPLIHEQLHDYSLLYRDKRADIRLAGLGDDAVAVGAAVLSGKGAV